MIESRIFLRRATPRDEKAIHRLFCVPEVFEYLADGQEPPPSVTSDWIRAAPRDRADYGGGLWLMVEGTDRLGGLARLAGDAHGELELTYLLHPRLWGLGLATRMAHTAMKHAFEAGKVSTLWAGADAPNSASLAVMKRLGMKFRREVQYPMGLGLEYQMTAEDFDPTSHEPIKIA